MKCWALENVCVCVQWSSLLGYGPLQRLSADLAVNGINRLPHVHTQSIDWYGSGVKKALSCVKSHLVSHPRQSVCKHAQALRSSDRSVWRILHNDLNLHSQRLQIVHSLSDPDKDLQFFRQFHGILTENPGLPNNLLKSDKEHFNLHRTVNKQAFQYWSAAHPHKLHQHPFITQKLLFGVL